MKNGLIVVLFSLLAVQANAQDNREVVWLTEAEQAELLKEMRGFLSASQQVLQAALEEDMQKIEAAARPMGIKLMKNTPPGLSEKLPEGFRALGPQAHQGFEDIADEASGLGDTQIILQRLAQMQKTCVACHAQYQFKTR